MSLSKGKSVITVLEGFGILLVAHAIGGYCFSQRLASVFNKMPLVTVEMLSSSAVSPIVAIIYLAWRCKFVPKFSISRETFLCFIAGIVLVWIVAFVSLLYFDRRIPFAQEIIKTNYPYYYLNLFLVVLWGPLLEETLVRGYFFEILKGSWSNTTALLLSSILFVIFHGIWGTFDISLLLILLYSIIFTLIYIEGGLIASIVVHAFANFYLTYLNQG